MNRSEPRRWLSQPLRVTAIYVVASMTWILFSDAVTVSLVTDPALIQFVSTAKGWLYVVVTSVLIYGVLEADRIRLSRSARDKLAVETRMAHMLAAVPDAVMVFDAGGLVVYANAGAETVTGVPLADLSGDIMHTRSWEFMDEAGDRMPIESLPHARVARTGRPIQGERVSFVRPDGVRAHVDVNAVPFSTGDDSPEGVLLTLTDTTERVRAAMRLARLNRLYSVMGEVSRAIVDLPRGSDVLDATCRALTESGGFRMAWIGMLDPASERILPVASAGFVDGYLDHAGITARDEPQGRGPTGVAVRTGEPVIVNDLASDPDFGPWIERAEARGYRASGAFPLIRDGSPVGALMVYAGQPGFFGDQEQALLERLADYISFSTRFMREQAELAAHRAHLEEMVAERTRELSEMNERLTQATVAKSQFLANMSHELRTPLNSIIGFSGILVQGLSGNLGSEQRKQVEMINRSGRYLLSLINDVLDLSRIEAGRIRLETDEFDVSEVARAVAASLRPQADDKGLELKVILPDHPVVMLSDPDKLRQILYNLAGNAVKFTERGTVEIAVRVDAGRTLVIDVADSGIGIAPDEIASVFEEFHQSEATELAKSQGTGLGLAISRRLAELLGGGITAASTLGEGSVFTVTLPLRVAGAATHMREDLPVVLIIASDHHDDGERVEGLGRAGMRVTGATTAAEGLELARACGPDAIVLDLDLPDMDGSRALESLKADARSAQVPVVCLSESPPDAYDGLVMADTCLVKPVATATLVEAVRRFIG